ncbi:Metalloenzyme domain protein [Ignavibacterium album JCM 16511]|uniref:Metalloenzyme domain protein n=2 Tax=Ignavibacterium album TaxID=591197 RepID=I0AKC3_IGNAJ|nr:Metalloenzyme domain protein [Ignavibacterium album JCM 16511]
MIFIDGVGIGKTDSEYNPFFKLGFKTFQNIFNQIPHLNNTELTANSIYLKGIDANLGVDGLPQSGTGQVSIFCGVNASALVGNHFGPFPHSKTIDVLRDKNIFREFLNKKKKVFFANAYPKIFFDYLKSGKTRLSATSMCCKMTNIRLNTATDVREANALTAEITNERWNKKLGYKIPVISAKAAARRLLRIASNYDFTLYEFFLTDHLGHGRIKDEFEKVHKNLDDFLFELLTKFDNKKMSIVICSDHGNYEDLSVKGHTRNPALFITAGKNAKPIADAVNDLTQIKSAIINNCM